jgi:hypothetical protein
VIPTPRRWEAHRGARELVLVHPDGLDAGMVCYEQGLRPLAPVGDLVARAIDDARTPFAAEAAGPARMMVTDEGEYAARVTFTGQVQGTAAQLDLGFVLLEESYSRIAALTTRPERFAAATAVVDDLVEGDGYLLGPRPRRTLYERPAGWHGLARGLLTEWYPARFPRDRATLTVWPALPTVREPVAWWRAGCQPELGFVPDGAPPPIDVISDHRLVGNSYCMVRPAGAEPAMLRHVVVLTDDRYVYMFRLDMHKDSHDPAHLAALGRTVRTTRAVPRARGARADRSVLDHWV